MDHPFKIEGQYVDIVGKNIFPAAITVSQGVIASVEKIQSAPAVFLLPGFIDAHVHIESSMLIPSSFACLAVTHGTIGTISDPHEIANVCGVEGIHYMIDNGKKVPFHFFFGAPSCVPATEFETAGAAIRSDAVATLLANKDIYYLSEMMNFPGVLFNDEEVMKKIAAAKKMGKPVDGHAPGLRGEEAKKYIEAGISTDHECFTMEEALDKLSYGMKILIREGSAAKNFEALFPLLDQFPDDIMLCSDDKHPDSLLEGHINDLCARAVAKGMDTFNVLKAACINPVKHYQLPTGLLKEGDPANFIVIKDLIDFKVEQTYINGIKVAEKGKSLLPMIHEKTINQFNVQPLTEKDIKLELADYPEQNGRIPVIEAIDGQLITNCLWEEAKKKENELVTDTEKDILKIVVYNRYHAAAPKIAFIKNFGFTTGAIASTVAHDSHNIIAVGVTDEAIITAINAVIKEQGGISCVQGAEIKVLGLPVAGLMSIKNPYEVAAAYTQIDSMAKSLGSQLGSPFMTLSFMALLVIPHLKLSDKGLFDGTAFKLF